mgnify:CR=1 FL=1
MTGFYKSDTFLIVQQMKATGNAPGLVNRWKDAVTAWALCNPGADADAVKAWLPLWQVRPFYTANELAPLWPALAVTLGLREKFSPIKSAHRLENELIFAGLPRRRMLDRNYFAVERVHYWRDVSDDEWLREYDNAQHG